MMSVPLLDLQAQYVTIRHEIQNAINAVLETQHFILGAEVEALEQEIASYTNTRFGIGVSSGSDALLISLMVLGIKPNDEVIVPTYTFFATAGAVARMGATPVFVDCDPHTYNLKVDSLERLITRRTKAIIPVHLFGQMAEMDVVMQVAEKHNLAVIEDAAQAIGSEYNGKRAGSIGHMACFSFFPSKNLGGIGDGGMVTTSDPELNERLRLFRNHGYKPKYYNRVVGGNFRLDAIQAAVLRVKLRYLDKWTEARQRNAAYYRKQFVELDASQSTDVKACRDNAQQPHSLILPVELPNVRHIYNQFVIRTSRRTALQNYLNERGIGNEVYYPVPLHLQDCFSDLGYKHGDLPLSEGAAQESLALPIYPELTDGQLQSVVQAVKHFFTDNR